MMAFLIQKINKNKWLILSVLIGFIIAVSIVTSVPMYSAGILKNVLIEDIESFSKKERIYPGTFSARQSLSSEEFESFNKAFTKYNNKVISVVDDLGLSVKSKKYNLSTDQMYVGKLDKNGNTYDEKGPTFLLEAVSDIESNIKIKQGKIFSDTVDKDGIYEAIVSEKTLKTLDLKIDEIYYTRKMNLDEKKYLKFKVVGVYTIDDEDNPFWVDKNWEHSNGILIHSRAFINNYMKWDQARIDNISWFYTLDYKAINVSNIKSILQHYNQLKKDMETKDKISINLAASEVLQKYIVRQKQLMITLWTIQAPVLIMILIYVFMLSGLIVEKDSNEIALLKSRGASNLQLFSIYLLEYSFIGFIGVIAGPFISKFTCRLLGSSNGFLKFVNRAPLPIEITKKEWLYSVCTGLVFILIMLIPALSVSKDSIVELKRSKPRSKKPLWQKIYLDFLLLGVSIYAVYSYKSLEKMVNLSKANANEIPISPLMYISLTTFIIGLGLVFLRFYPYLIKLILRIGKNKWSAPAYVSLINVSRNKNRDGFLMIFLILTLSIGIFNMKSASTINTLAENKVKYLNGADIVIKPWWLTGSNSEKKSYTSGDQNEIPGLFYKEPDVKPFFELEGIESSTKVLRADSGSVKFLENFAKRQSQIMAINPDEFGKTAWFDSSLLPYHWYYYLNMIAEEPRGVIISNSLKNDLNLNLGDKIDVRWGRTLFFECYVLGFVDYWPGYNTNDQNTPHLVVLNLNYVNALTPTQPYEIWMKKKPEVSNNVVYNDIIKKQLSYESIKTVHQGIYELKNDPILQGTNGTLTLCFLSSLIITCMGFLIYWTLSIKNRTLQFGILRAIGLSMKKIFSILIGEQLLISGISIVMGIIIGSISSNIFIPMLNLSTNPKEKLLPFKPVSFFGSYVKLTLFMVIVLCISIFILTRIVKKIKIDQALKLGED